MHLIFKVSKHFLPVLFVMLGIVTKAQPPVTEPGQSDAPVQIDPKSMNSSELSSLLNDANNTGADKNASLVRSNSKVNRDSLSQDNIKNKELTKLSTYGENVFSGAASYDIGELSTPPLDYPIGVGDNIIVALWGGAEYQNSYVVGRDGSIFPKGLGKIIVQGLTFEVAREIIARRFMSAVPGGTNIAVTIGQPRSISVNVVGNVNSPGQIVVSAFANAFNVIALAGGTNEYADLRNILVKRNGVIIDSLDVYTYLTTGDVGKHIYLQNNDFVIIGTYKKKVLATGQFKRPMYYQLKEHEGVRALLNFSGGLTPDAFASGMAILRSENETQVQKDVNANAIIKIKGLDETLFDGDIVRVPLIKTGIANKVELNGEVKYPGIYEIRPGDRLFDIINRAGGVTKNTYMGRAYIFRGAGDSTNLKSDKLEVSLEDMADSTGGANSRFNLPLYANDKVLLFNANNFGDPQFVEIYGEVRKEGKVRKYGGMNLEDLLLLAGGIKPTAEFGRLEISSIVDIDSARQGLKPTRTVVKSYAISNNLLEDSTAKKIILKPYDQVFVRKNPTFEFQQNIDVKGLVKYPGLYPRLSKFERLSSYIDRAGGIQENANLSGAVLFRRISNVFEENLVTQSKLDKEKLDTTLKETIIKDSAKSTTLQANFNEPISIDLYRAMKYRNSKHDIILQEGDVIVIPEVDPFVKVEGSVQNPLKLAFDKANTRVLFYIDKAGGFGERPWKRRISVKYADGKSKRTRNLLFLHFYPKVEEGAKIIVPVRPEMQNIIEATKQLIVSAIPVMITAFIFKKI